MSVANKKIKEYKRRIEVMEAFGRGEKIEFNNGFHGVWRTFGVGGTPMWDWKNCDYRIKEKEKDPLISWYAGVVYSCGYCLKPLVIKEQKWNDEKTTYSIILNNCDNSDCRLK